MCKRWTPGCGHITKVSCSFFSRREIVWSSRHRTGPCMQLLHPHALAQCFSISFQSRHPLQPSWFFCIGALKGSGMHSALFLVKLDIRRIKSLYFNSIQQHYILYWTMLYSFIWSRKVSDPRCYSPKKKPTLKKHVLHVFIYHRVEFGSPSATNIFWYK